MVLIFDVDPDQRPSARGLRFDAVNLAHLLTGAFDGVGDFPGHFFGTGPRIKRDDQGLFDREFRILKASEILIRKDPANNEDKRQCKDDPVVFD